MKSYRFFIFILFGISLNMDCARRQYRPLTERPTMYVPVPLYDENEQLEIMQESSLLKPIKPNWLLHIFQIIANIGKAILERENREQMHHHVGNIFDNVASLAQEFSTRSISKPERKKIIEQIIQQLNDLALPEPIVMCSSKKIDL